MEERVRIKDKGGGGEGEKVVEADEEKKASLQFV